jgi:chemotaxis protein methyltransferase WspC
VVIPETYFFRNRQSFVFLDRYLKQEWLPQHGHSRKSLRVLSFPCSTGEEPYSIAITLAKAGLNLERVRIDAIDISRKALDKAERAIYEDYSFRQQSLTDRQTYFHKLPEGYQLCEEIRRCVKFEHGNILDSFFSLEHKPYDLIFCRNLLIYFHPAARIKAMQVLDRLLVDRGMLFVGYAETTQIDHSKFVSVGHSLTFAYQKQPAPKVNIASLKPANSSQKVGNSTKAINLNQSINSNAPNTPKALLLAKKSHGLQSQKRSNQKHDRRLVYPSSPQTPQPAHVLASSTQNKQLAKPPALSDRSADCGSASNSQAHTLLQTARSLADAGQLAAAAELCQAYLSQDSICAHAHVLHGEILQAMGQANLAEDCWQKALYLQPDYYEALVHLALLKEQRGDRLGAAVIFQRIRG